MGQLGLQKTRQNLLIRHVGQSELVEVVGIHELVEHVRAEHHCFRDHHIGIVESVQVGMLHDDMVQESQPAPLSAKGTITDTGEIAVTVETVALEHGHHALVLHPTIAHDGIENNLAMGIHVLQRAPRNVFEKFRDGKQGARTEPTRHVVARDMVKERFLGKSENVVLQVFQVLYAGHFLHRVGVKENEIAETEILTHQPTEIHTYLLRILVDELRSALFRPHAFVRLGRLQDKRHELILGTDSGKQLVSRHLVSHPVARKTAVTNDPQRVLLVTAVQVPRFLIRPGQHDFRTSAHAQRFELCIECLGGKLQTLLEHETIQVGQDGRIETNGILYKQNHLHSRRHIVLQVHLVLYQLNDGKQKIRVAQPTEHIIEIGKIHVLHALAYAMAKRSKHHDGNRRIVFLNAQSNVEHIVVVRSRHANHQVKGGAGQFLFRFFLGSHLKETWRIAQPQLHVFIENFLVHPPVIFQHEGIVWVGNQKHVENPPFHQIHERCVAQQRAFPVIVIFHNR